MADGGGPRTHRYSAFISYSHRDAAFARRLHRQLETYRLPRRLAHSDGSRGRRSRKLEPVFLDRADLPAHKDLPDIVEKAIAGSRHLIVVCTPNSARSKWVGQEIKSFRKLHGDGVILAALFEGSSGESFHPALKAPGPDGRPLQPLAADFRRHGDGRLALLKLLAVLADVRLDDLVQRDAQRRVRQITWISAGALAGMAVTATLAVMAIEARGVAKREQGRLEATNAFMLTDLRDKLKKEGRLDLLEALSDTVMRAFRGLDLSTLPDSQLAQWAKLLQEIGEDTQKRGDLALARSLFEEAWETTSALLKAKPDDWQRIYNHAQSEYWIGFVNWQIGDYEKAEQSYMSYAVLAQQLVSLTPDDAVALTESGDAESDVGVVALRRNCDYARAESLFKKSLDSFRRVERIQSDGSETEIDIADNYAWFGDISRLRGDYNGALVNRHEQNRILTQILQKDPHNVSIRSRLIGNQLAVARIDAARGLFGKAIDEFREGHAAAVNLAESDPDNAELSVRVRIFDLFEARTLLIVPMTDRPADSVIVTALGNCEDDAARYKMDELSIFCWLEHARRLVSFSNNTEADAILEKVVNETRLQPNCLTEHWGLNIREEIESIKGCKQGRCK